MRSDRIQHRLDDAVTAGRLTQEQADAYKEWYEARPEGLNLGRKGHGQFGFGGGGEGDDGGPSQRFGGRGLGGSHRFGGQDFHGQGQLPSDQGGDVPEGSGTSY